MKRESVVSLGLAMFTMLFGAGNIVFPLVLGKACGGDILPALLGFAVTAVALPILGFIATMLCEGDFNRLLRYLGTFPGALVVFLIMLLIGPLCAIPRCMLLSLATLRSFFPSINKYAFALISSIIVFWGAYKPAFIVKSFGRFFGPLKLGLIGFLVFKCMTVPPVVAVAKDAHPFIEGLVAGYETMDLLAALVITGLMAVSMPWVFVGDDKKALRNVAKKASSIGMIGGLALSVVYVGFGLSAARLSGVFGVSQPDELLVSMAVHVLGNYGKIVAAVIVLVTCITTAVVLSAASARYMEHVFRDHRGTYEHYLLGACLLAGAMSMLGFDMLTRAVEPVVLILYPVVILLACAVIALKLWGARGVKFVGPRVEQFFAGSARIFVRRRVVAAKRVVEKGDQASS